MQNRILTSAATAILITGCASGPRMEPHCVEHRMEVRYHTALKYALPIAHKVCVRTEMRAVKRW